MANYAMLIDPDRCTGCGACRMACQMQWQLAPKMYYNRVEFKESGKYPNAKMEILPVQCQHCEEAPCLNVCPTGATNKGHGGIINVDSDNCIQCKACFYVCPYDARVIDQETGVPGKCKFCAGFISQGETCVSTCMNDVRVFGDLDDPTSKITKLMKEKDVYQLLTREGTKPSIYYVGNKLELSGK
ncbi:4Fe-4S dicluster domain-containing protein [Natroniella sulfidigena]|uniref:4Fe-4S dicluster domain-containing protein n=1 Tax=Natroniella sulfidigena TaxID=723921 RepID=UPI002009E135|nr:4Fe-4S dicluster domain-containing protein [Natroniella sulfidigena]MCK8817019.1 4Fe-4S dicluster domain-containing protein [Natroniella sulfidigena]